LLRFQFGAFYVEENLMDLSLNSAFAMFTIALIEAIAWLAHNIPSADPIEHIRGGLSLLVATVALGFGLILLQFYKLHERWEDSKNEASATGAPASTS
jgi:hypothetical protein